MTMDSMEAYLRKRGFDVQRDYIRHRQEYRFRISKNGSVRDYYWKYEKNIKELSASQEKALTNMIKDFNEKELIKNTFKIACNSLHGSLDEGYVYMPNMDVESLYPKTLPIREYVKADNELTKIIERRVSDVAISIKDVIFNDPATIVFWSDGTKTVVKAVNEPFDKEKGLAMAIAKKYFGNKGSYYNNIKKWLD